MEKQRTILAAAAVLLAAMVALGMTTQPPQRGPARGIDEADLNATRNQIAHDIGNIRMTFSNWGEQGNPDGTPGFRGFEFPIGSGNDFLFSAGIWVGAKRNGIARVSTGTDGDNGTNEFWPEHIGSVPDQPNDPDWHLSSTAMDSLGGKHYVRGARGVDDDGDWSAATDDLDGNGIPSYNWDGGRGWIGLDDDGDGLIDEETANGADDDGDSRIDEDTDNSGDANGDGNCYYDPEPRVDEDPPGDKSADWQDNDHDGLVDAADPDFDGDAMPGSFDDDGDGVSDEDAAAWGYQEFFTVYQDSISAPYVGSPDPGGYVPLDIEVSQRTYAWPDESLADFIIAEFTVRNRGNVVLDSVFIGVFADPDICAAGEGGDQGSLDDYNYFDPNRLMMVQYDDIDDDDGAAPGAFAVRVLRTPAPLDSLRMSFKNYERVSGGDPYADVDKYIVMSSGDVDPLTSQQGDWRMLMAFGREMSGGFAMAPGSELRFWMAYIGAPDTASIGTASDRAMACVDSGFAFPTEAYPTRAEMPQEFTLHPNFPNPFNPATTLRFDLGRSGQVKLAIYNLLGQELRVLLDVSMPAGTHQVMWDGADRGGRALGSGVYFARLETADGVRFRKLVMVR